MTRLKVEYDGLVGKHGGGGDDGEWKEVEERFRQERD